MILANSSSAFSRSVFIDLIWAEGSYVSSHFCLKDTWLEENCKVKIINRTVARSNCKIPASWTTKHSSLGARHGLINCLRKLETSLILVARLCRTLPISRAVSQVKLGSRSVRAFLRELKGKPELFRSSLQASLFQTEDFGNRSFDRWF